MIGVPVRIAAMTAAVLCLAGPESHAQSQPPAAPPISKECQPDGVTVTGTTPLPNAERALRERKVLRILAIGATPPRGLQRRGGDYLQSIETMLEKSIKGLDVQIVNRGVSGELAASSAERIKTEVALEQPDLLLWQVGTRDAFARIPLDEFTTTVVDMIRWLKAHKVDVALVGLHYLRSLAEDPHYQAIRQILRSIADEEKIPRIGRYEATQVIERMQARGADQPPDEFVLTEEGYGCLAEYVVRTITSGIFARALEPKPKP